MRCLIFILFSISFIPAFSQELDSLNTEGPVDAVIDTAQVQPQLTDTTQIQTQRKGDIETTINYNANDSLFFDVKSQELFLYGDTHIDYGDISLEAERTSVDWNKRTIHSKYLADSTGRKVGKPVYTDLADVYATDDILYNFDTRKALIKGVITEQDGAFMHGDDVKKNSEDELFIKGARYTTCNLEDPHFSIESTKLKVIPNNKVVSGPFNMRFRDLPTPLFFPFGMFPQPKEKASGIIFPSYGEERRRGFFLRGGGYYFAINDYIDARITGDIYSKGGNGVNVTSNYFKKYAYRGTFNFSYNKSVSDDIENPLETNDYWIRWNHSPQSKGNSSISASVSAGTSTYNQNNNLVNQDFNRSINSQFASNISYRKKFQGSPFNMSVNLRHSQNLSTEVVNLTLPDFTLNMNRIYPFKNIVKSSKSPLAKLNFSHNFVARNEISNSPVRTPSGFTVSNSSTQSGETLPFNSDNFGAIFDRARVGGKHTIPISTSMTFLKYFTLNPSFNYEEFWYTKELDYTFIPEENAVRIDTVQGFSRAGSWSSGASLNTRIYGTAFFKKGKIQAIRHVMTPSISFSYSPDFSDTRFGVYKEVQIDTTSTNENNTRILSRYEGFVFGSPRGGESKTLGFSLSNNIEMKVASKKDTVTGSKKIKVFDNLGLSSGYNFAADSFKLSNININARTSFFNNKVSLNFTGTLDPYEYLLLSESISSSGVRTVSQRRLDRFTWNNGNGLGRLSRMNVAIGINLAPKRGNKSRNNPSQDTSFGPQSGIAPPDEQVNYEGYTEEEQMEIANIQNNPEAYVDFAVPWSLRMQYSVNRTKTGFQDATIRQSFQFSGTLGLTEKTQLTFNSGYDFESKEFTSTRIGISRDLHCWSMNFDWVPFGRFQSYFLSIRVKSSLLQD
ncbi:MAG: putative LPS assembly protein LptD, partial [Bacteroidota bacterium]